METVGVGEITYECRDKKDAAGRFEGSSSVPTRHSNDRGGKQVGKYVQSAATGKALTARKSRRRRSCGFHQRRQHPAAAGQGNPATGNGAMTGVTFIQRVATKGRRGAGNRL